MFFETKGQIDLVRLGERIVGGKNGAGHEPVDVGTAHAPASPLFSFKGGGTLSTVRYGRHRNSCQTGTILFPGTFGSVRTLLVRVHIAHHCTRRIRLHFEDYLSFFMFCFCFLGRYTHIYVNVRSMGAKCVAVTLSLCGTIGVGVISVAFM